MYWGFSGRFQMVLGLSTQLWEIAGLTRKPRPPVGRVEELWRRLLLRAVSSPEQRFGVNCWKQVDLWSQVQYGKEGWRTDLAEGLGLRSAWDASGGSADVEDAVGRNKTGSETGVLWPG